MKMVKLRFTGNYRMTTQYVGALNPGEEVEVTEEQAAYLLRGMFEVVKEEKIENKAAKKRAAKKKRGDVNDLL